MFVIAIRFQQTCLVSMKLKRSRAFYFLIKKKKKSVTEFLFSTEDFCGFKTRNKT